MSFEVPAACTLPTAARPLRLAEFDALFATALRRQERLSARRGMVPGSTGVSALIAPTA
jgi:hypothetical protein